MNMQPGQIISGEFMLQKLLAERPAGAVWRALEINVGRLVRLSFVPDSVMNDEAVLQRLRKHFTAIQKFKYPHIVPSERFVEQSEAGAFFVSRFVEGYGLDEYITQWIQAEGKFPFHLLSDVFRPIASALDEAKTQNLVHRTLTPRWIVVSQTEGIQIYDFGLTGIIRESLPNKIADSLESIRYLAPEQIFTNKASAKSDQYAFAMIIAEVLGNKILYPANSTEEFRTLIQTAAPLLPGYSDTVNTTLQQALHRDPAVRFSSCLQLLDHLISQISVTPPTSLTPNIVAVSSIPASISANISVPTPDESDVSEPPEDIVSFQKAISFSQSATAGKIAGKIGNKRRTQLLFWFWNFLLLIGIFVAVYLFRDHIALVWKQRGQNAAPIEVAEQNENLRTENESDKVKPKTPIPRKQRTRKSKEENFDDVGGSAFQNVDGMETPDEVRFLGTSGCGKKIVFVVDTSAVMGNGENTPWEHIQKELVFSFKDLNPSQHFQVVYFNEAPAILPNTGSADLSDPWISVSPETLKNSYNFLKTVQSSGQGNPQKALEKALSMKPDVVFFISDQESTALSLREINELKKNAEAVPINGVEIGGGTEPQNKSPIQILTQTFHGEYKWIDGNIHGLKR